MSAPDDDSEWVLLFEAAYLVAFQLQVNPAQHFQTTQLHRRNKPV